MRFLSGALHNCCTVINPGKWGVAVSGGADSTALLRLSVARPGLEIVAVHLNHETRGEESDGDEQFVAQLAGSLGIAFCSTQLSRLPKEDAPANPSARYRAARIRWFRQIVFEQQLQGILVAHHADDQAETIAQRLLRGSGYRGLTGMRPQAVVGGVLMVRPLLNVRHAELVAYLQSIGQAWRTDSSNLSDQYERNVVRKMLAENAELHQRLIELGESARQLRDWVQRHRLALPETFPAVALAKQPAILAEESAIQWLAAAGCPREELTVEVARRLVTMAADAATPSRQAFPGEVTLRRNSGWIRRDNL